MVPKRQVGSKEKRDTFAETWGAPTPWKTGVPYYMRHTMQPEVDPTHNIPPKSTLVGAPKRLLLLSTLNKALPPVPYGCPGIVEGASDMLDIAKPAEAPRHAASPTSVLTSILRFRRRRRPEDHRQLDSEPQSRGELQQQQQESSKQVGPSFEDKGVQTSPRLLPFRPIETSSEVANMPRPSQSRKVWFNKKSSELMSPTEVDARGPVSSPKGVWTKSAPTDYFSIPSQFPEGSSPSIKTSSSQITPKSSILKGPSAIPKRTSEESLDSIGTYDSHYSEISDDGADFPLRPFLPKHPMSEPSLPSGHMAESATNPRERPHVHERAITSDSVKRTMPMPFDKFPSFSASRSRKRPSSAESGGTTASLLRHEIKLPDRQSHHPDAQPPTPSFFQVPIITPQGQAEFLSFIPEHLKGSPLCPANPKHKSGGLEFCPWHGGRNGSDNSKSESLDFFQGGDESSSGTSSPARPTSNATEVTPDDLMTPFNVNAPRHFAGSPECPASNGGKAVCIYHGRPKATASTSSEDSGPSERLILT